MAEKEPAKPDFSPNSFINGLEDAIFMAVVYGKPVEDTSTTRAALAGRKCIGEIKQGEKGALTIDYTGGGKVVEACGKCMWGGGYRGDDPTDVCPVYESDTVLKFPGWGRNMLVPPKAEGEYEWEPEGGEGDDEDDDEGGEPEEKKGILGRLGDKIGEFIGGIDLGEMGEGLKGAGENIEKWLGEKFGAVGGWLNSLKPGGGGGEGGGGEGGGGESGGEGGGGEDGGGESKGEGGGGEDGGGEGEGEEAKPGEEPPEVAEAGKGVIADIKEKVKGAWEGIKGKIKGLLPGMPTIPGLGGKGGEDGDEGGEPTEGPEPDGGREKAHKPYKNHAIFHFVLRSFYDRAYQPDQLISPSRLSFPVELLQGVFVGENVREQLEISASYFRKMFGYRRQTPLYFVEGTVDEAAARSTFRDPMFNCLRPDYETFVEPNTGIRFRYLVLRLEKFPDQEARSVLDNFYQEYKFQRRVVPVSDGEKQVINGLGGILGRMESGLNPQNPSPAETQGSAVVDDMHAVGQELQAVWVSLSGIQSRLGSAGLSAEKYEEYGRVLPALENELQELIALSTQQPSDESRQQFARLKARVEVNFAEISRLYKLHYGEIDEQIEHVVSNMESNGVTIVDVMFLEGALRKRLAKKLSLCAACGLNSICTEPNARRGEIRRRKTIPDPVPQGPDLGRMVHGQPQTPPDESVSGQQEPIVVPPGRLAQGGGVNTNADSGASRLVRRRSGRPKSPYEGFIRGDDQQTTEGLHGVSEHGQDGDIQMIDYPPSGQAANAGSIDQTGLGDADQTEPAVDEDDDTDGVVVADYEESDDLEADDRAIQDESEPGTEVLEPKKGKGKDKDKLARVVSVTPSQRPHGPSAVIEP